MSSSSSSKIIGAMFLTAGSCIGAGMLGLPILAGLSGFFPSLVMMTIAWLFMTFTALLLVEVNGWFHERVNLISMIGKALGRNGQILAWILYLFLFYALLIAYVAVSGHIFSSIIPVSNWILSILFTLFFGYFVYLGTRLVDLSNRWMMIGLIICYLAMIALGLSNVQFSLLQYVKLKYILLPLSVMITSFGFHNIIPSLTSYLDGNLQEVRRAILGGSCITYVVYFFWNCFVLGLVPFEGQNGIYESFIMGKDATIVLNHYAQSSSLGFFIQGFSLFAIITSFLAQGLGLTHFIADGLHIEPVGKNKLWLTALALAPPLMLALIYPTIFFVALSFAGGFCAVILFGIMPSCMVWIGRYKNKAISAYHVAGGKFSLIFGIGFSSFLLVMEILRMFGFIDRT